VLDLNTYSIVVAAMFTTVVFILSKRLTAVKQTTTEQKRAEKADTIYRIKKFAWTQASRNIGDLTKKEYLVIGGSSLAIMLLIAFALNNFFIAILGGVLAYSMPRYVIRRNRQSEYKLKVKLLRPALQAIASAHSYRPNILAAIQQATGSMQDPIKKDFELFLYDIETGTPLREALQSLQKRINVSYLDLFCKVVIMASEEGGRTHDVLKTCVEIIEDDIVTMAEFEAEIAREKTQAYTLMALQYAVFGFVALSQPAAFSTFIDTLFGQLFVAYILVSTLFVWHRLDKLTDTSTIGVRANV
jgi:tight adherence protein B